MKIISKTLMIVIVAIMGIAFVSCEKEIDALTPELGVERQKNVLSSRSPISIKSYNNTKNIVSEDENIGFTVQTQDACLENLYIKFYFHINGNIEYKKLVRISDKLFYLFRSFPFGTKVSYRIVDKNYNNIEEYPDNRSFWVTSKYTINSNSDRYDKTTWSHLHWPFGADGSNWRNRKGWINGEEDGLGIGGAWFGEYLHKKEYGDFYSEDWNKNNDLGAIFQSPVSGNVVISNKHTCYGYNVKIRFLFDGNEYDFHIAHLKEPSPLSVGDHVNIGDYIGKIGGSGCVQDNNGNISYSDNAYGPHMHCTLRRTGVPLYGSSIPFDFSAE